MQNEPPGSWICVKSAKGNPQFLVRTEQRVENVQHTPTDKQRCYPLQVLLETHPMRSTTMSPEEAMSLLKDQKKGTWILFKDSISQKWFTAAKVDGKTRYEQVENSTPLEMFLRNYPLSRGLTIIQK